jgi:alpha-mannosidase
MSETTPRAAGGGKRKGKGPAKGPGKGKRKGGGASAGVATTARERSRSFGSEAEPSGNGGARAGGVQDGNGGQSRSQVRGDRPGVSGEIAAALGGDRPGVPREIAATVPAAAARAEVNTSAPPAAAAAGEARAGTAGTASGAGEGGSGATASAPAGAEKAEAGGDGAVATGPSLAEQVKRFWETWIWRPEPAVRKRPKRLPGTAAAAGGVATGEAAGAEAEAAAEAVETLTGDVYLIPISHLDTQWRWTVRDTVAKYLPATVRDNVAAFERFPSYRVNFDGAFRYRLLAEHHPELFAEVKRWVEAGRWQVTGATWDALDVNLPGPESFVRHVLYGRRWFRKHLARDPRDLFLPDCFGFGAHVPVLAAHCGLIGFATSKLRRFDDMRSAFGIPFPLGWWEGPDGSRLLAALEPGGYGEPLLVAPGDDPEVEAQLRRHDAALDRSLAVRFFGIGDKGGAPGVKSLEKLEAAAKATSGVRTHSVGASELFTRLAAELPADRLPVYRNELLLSTHGTGCYTSQAGMKRWNASNERLAAAAERAAAAAAWLGAAPYPAERLREAWQRFLWHQFHDDLTGTSIPAAYDISWHDEALAAGELGEVLRASVGAIARGLDTRAEGVPLVVFNPLPVRRRELVSARLPWEPGAGVEVLGPTGEPLLAQAEDAGAGHAWVRFQAELPPLGFAVFDVRRSATPATVAGADPLLRCSRSGLETSRHLMLLDTEGNLSSLWDKRLDRELLGAPLRLELFSDRSPRFPAWEVHWEDLEQGAADAISGPAEIVPLASGPAAVSLEVRQRHGRSLYVSRYRLAAGQTSDALEVELAVRWRTRRHLLKATLTTTAAGRDATYDMGVAGVARGPSKPALYEVPAQGWADLSQDGNSWGVAMLTDRAHGWDHPLPHVLRLTLLRTPATGRRFPHQSFQDLGDHHFRFAIAGHAGSWSAAGVPALAQRFRHRALPFVTEASAGPLGREWSFLEVEGDAELAALKEHEENRGEWVVRLLDPAGRGGDARLRVPGTVEAVREVDGCEDERPVGADEAAITVDPIAVTVPLRPHRPRAVALRVSPPQHALLAPRSTVVPLPHDRRAATRRGEPSGEALARRIALPDELLPRCVKLGGGIRFELAERGAPANATACDGQRVPLPAGEWEHLWLLLANGGDATSLQIGDRTAPLELPSSLEPLARPDRVRRFGLGPWALWSVRPGHVIEAPVAWVAGHCHDASGADLPYRQAALFAVSIPLLSGTRAVDLPLAPQVLVFAATATLGAGQATSAWGADGPLLAPI